MKKILIYILCIYISTALCTLPHHTNNKSNDDDDDGGRRGAGGKVPPHATQSFDCAARSFAWEYAQAIQSWRTNLKEVYDALELATLCNTTYRAPVISKKYYRPRDSETIYYVAVNGSDSNAGSLSSPFQTIQKALSVAANNVGGVTIYLREGIFYIGETIMMGPEHSNIIISNYADENVEINGGIPLTTSWKAYDTTSPNNIWVADLTGQNIQSIPGLQMNGQRCTRARYPNSNPEIDLYPEGWSGETVSWMPPIPAEATTTTTESPSRDTGIAFNRFTLGTGGACFQFEPPQSYWCSSNCSGGGAFTYIVPSGFVYNKSAFGGRVWNNPAGAVIHAWHPGHWENWMFELDTYDASTQSITWKYGGFQGARGATSGELWYVDNVFEELDAPNEYFYDAESQQLYLFYNGTGAPPVDSVFSASNLKVLINITGSQADPVNNITLTGITFRNTAYTYMDPHGVPSGGDWSLQRTGAIFMEGTVGTIVESCLFIRLDGIGLFLSGFNRNVSIEKNEFVWIGDSAMASWGYTIDNGIDGTDGNFPRYTRVIENMVHEHGQYTKQTSAWVQAKSAQTYFQGNIFFNGPRAGININDGFGGGNELTGNLLFNQVRETYDHGPFNSWDRQPFLTTVADGTPSLNPAYSHIHHNMFICNYYSQACIDNDDGSTFYMNYNNFEVYGCHKDYFAGHNKFTFDTVLAFPVCWGYSCAFYTEFVPGYVDGLYNVSCIMSNNNPYASLTGDAWNQAEQLPVMHDNKIYNTDVSLTISVNGQTISEADWQAKGNDLGTTVYPVPSDDEIISMGKAVLGWTD
eukprot:TRINITY_DN4197_c0_g1_i1.p1 TRINITY_DN4197_c0_g1~~TRINITY_DN4197_c0_g1_i1.p1  ORF type:complete len:808 (-),score=212.17 TRINITY_DN4197_c0_g1_i1:52-2475(-)